MAPFLLEQDPPHPRPLVCGRSVSAAQPTVQRSLLSILLFQRFKEEFTGNATSLFGSGWTWLVLQPHSGLLLVLNTANQDSPLSLVCLTAPVPVLLLFPGTAKVAGRGWGTTADIGCCIAEHPGHPLQ